MTAQQIWQDLVQLRQRAPLVHNITNYVVMNNTANALLAIGASPVMAHAVEEVKEMVAIADALVVNIGTLSQDWIRGMALAMRAAQDKGIPIVFDPVGIGATPYRNNSCHELLSAVSPTIIRGNGSEIMALTDVRVKTRGVDSATAGTAAEAAALRLAQESRAVVVVSGAEDLITDGETLVRVANGHFLMPRVTGLGCTASALAGAFAVVSESPLQAAVATMAVMGICGEIAAEKASGPGTLQLYFLDALYQLDREQIVSRLKVVTG